MTIIKDRIISKLNAQFSPLFLEVINESHRHNVPEYSETHFKLIVVAEGFVGQRPVARHQAIYQVLSAEMKESIHALALHLYSPQEWHELRDNVPVSPGCRGAGIHQ